MTTLWFDCETYSECNLKTHALHRYAEHPTTEITVVQWAVNDGEPVVWDCTANGKPMALLILLQHKTVTVVAHNSQFDRTVLRHVWGVDVPVRRWRDTMVKAMAHGLPGGLDKLGPVLGLPIDEQKDKRGQQLIQLFCKPRSKNSKVIRATRETHPTEWAEFIEYSRQDIIAMRAIDRKLPLWNVRENGAELALWHLDQDINDRGFAVDLDLAQAAITAADAEKRRLDTDVQQATGGAVSAATQRDALLAHILEAHGVTLPDMAADTLRRRAEDPELPNAVRELIGIRLEASRTSVSKYAKFLKTTSSDGRLRGTTQFCGAQRTGRWAGRVVQPQNFMRPTMSAALVDAGIQALKADAASLLFDNVLMLTANTMRGMIIATPGHKLVAADLSNIEGRVLAWLASERWKLKAFADYDSGKGEDLYKVAYGRAFNVTSASVGKNDRQIGKVMELALGYEGGVGAFLTFAAVYKMDLAKLAEQVHSVAHQEQTADALGMYKWAQDKGRTYGLSQDVYVACEILKAAWRKAHPKTATLWRELRDAFNGAVQTPGTPFTVGCLKLQRDGAWLRVKLPSSRYVCYLHPKVEDGNGLSYAGVNQYTRKWDRIHTYGGKLVENITQAVARDVMAAAMHPATDQGYLPVLSVHDELITETPDKNNYSHEALAKIMSTNPLWSLGLPLAAAGFESYRYRKED